MRSGWRGFMSNLFEVPTYAQYQDKPAKYQPANTFSTYTFVSTVASPSSTTSQPYQPGFPQNLVPDVNYQPYLNVQSDEAAAQAIIEDLKKMVRADLGERLKGFSVERIQAEDGIEDEFEYVVLVIHLNGVTRNERQALREKLHLKMAPVSSTH